MQRFTRFIIAAGLSTAAGGSIANAQIIYSMNVLANTGDGTDELIMFDSSDPAGYTIVGNTGVEGISFGGLDFDASGNMYAYAALYKDTGGSATGLYSVNPDTGATTLIGDSLQSIQDIAYNPVDGKMYGVNTRFGAETSIFEINLATGATTTIGIVSGMPIQHHIGGLAISSSGEFFIHDVVTDAMYSGDGSSFTHMYDLGIDTGYAQGMTIDWAHGDMGYHGAVGQGEWPNYFSTVNTFDVNGGFYNIGDPFGPNDPDGIPPVQPGDLAINPIPGPSAGIMLLAAGLLGRRRRRN